MSSDDAKQSMTSFGPTSSETGAASMNLFVGGCYRSGTTLLEKLLHQHPEVTVASQPFPDLYFYCKGVFDEQVGLRRRYPLGHLFLEDGYEAEAFHGFLDTHQLDHEALHAVLESMASNTLGLWTPQILGQRDQVVPGPFLAVYRQLNNAAAALYGNTGCRYVGGKEVLCEEYVPYLVAHGSKAILVVRDPRDMIASLNFRQRENKTGANRPVLYSLRLWRKSVAVCVALENDPDFLWLRYEDLAADPDQQLARIADFLSVAPFETASYAKGLRTQDGGVWRGNSSFGDHSGVATGSIGRFIDTLPPEVTRYVEACCLPEMLYLGYEPSGTDPVFEESAITGYRDPFTCIHPKFPPNYSWADGRPELEIERYRLMTTCASALSIREQRRWFIFPETYRRLREIGVGPANRGDCT